MEKKQNKKVILGVVAFIAVAVILGAVYYFTKPETSKGAKEVEITVVSKEGEKQSIRSIRMRNTYSRLWMRQKKKDLHTPEQTEIMD